MAELVDSFYAVPSASVRSNGAPSAIKGSLNYGASVNASASGEATGAPAIWAVAFVGLAFLLLHFG